MGYSAKEAAYQATRQIGWPVVSATVTTVLAFIPIIMMHNKSGAFIKSLPVTIISTLTVSLILALTVTPLAASMTLKKPEKENLNLSRALQKLIEGPYRNTLNFSLNNKWITLSIAVLVFAFSAFVYVKFVGVSFFPKAEQPQLLLRINMPEGTSLDKTDEAARYVESVIDTFPQTMHYATNVGHGNPRIYYNTLPKNYSKNFAEIFVRLKEYKVDEFDKIVSNLRKHFSTYSAGKINVKEFEQGTPVAAPVVINIMGKEIKTLQKISDHFEKKMEGVNGLVNI
jgi:multidrug efflux pump subunit AcrB